MELLFRRRSRPARSLRLGLPPKRTWWSRRRAPPRSVIASHDCTQSGSHRQYQVAPCCYQNRPGKQRASTKWLTSLPAWGPCRDCSAPRQTPCGGSPTDVERRAETCFTRPPSAIGSFARQRSRLPASNRSKSQCHPTLLSIRPRVERNHGQWSDSG